jgi:hypothetical protein
MRVTIILIFIDGKSDLVVGVPCVEYPLHGGQRPVIGSIRQAESRFLGSLPSSVLRAMRAGLRRFGQG